MSKEEYALLKQASKAAGLSANAWLMGELETNRPRLYRDRETRAAIVFADEVGRDINAVAGPSTAAMAPPSSWSLPSTGWPRWWSGFRR